MAKNQFSWESLDDIEARFHYLSKEERAEKVKAEVASATKKSKHPTRKGEFIYKLWRSRTETEISTASKSRRLCLEAEVETDAADILASAMTKEVVGSGSSASKALPAEPAAAEEAQPKPKRKATPKAASAATPASELKKVERDVMALVMKLTKAKLSMEALEQKLQSDEALLAGLCEKHETAMAMVSRITTLKLSLVYGQDPVTQLYVQGQELNIGCAVLLKQCSIRLKSSKK